MANKVYQNAESAVTWTDSGGDEDLDLGGLSAGSGRVGSYLDRTASARPSEYEWRLKIDGFDASPTVGETINVYLAQSDGTLHDGPVGFNDTADAALASTNILRNLRFVGQCVVRSTTAGDDLVASGRVKLTSRYVIPVIHNNTSVALLSTSDSHQLVLTPVPPEIQ